MKLILTFLYLVSSIPHMYYVAMYFNFYLLHFIKMELSYLCLKYTRSASGISSQCPRG